MQKFTVQTKKMLGWGAMMCLLLWRAGTAPGGQDTKTYKLTVRVSDSISQEITIKPQDDFHVSTNVLDSTLLVNGSNQLVDGLMKVKLKVNWEQGKAEKRAATFVETTAYLKPDGKETLLGGANTVSNGVPAESKITVSLQN